MERMPIHTRREGTGGETAGRRTSVLCTRGKDASSLPGEEAGFGQLGHGGRGGLWKFSVGIGLSLGDVGIL